MKRTGYVINCRGRLLDLGMPCIMGILNLTPDSFYAGSRVNVQEDPVHRAGRMLEEGAAILDLGAVSTRPGADMPDEETEWQRLRPALIQIRQHFPECIVSIDTFRSGIARRALAEGADMINDISGGRLDENMYREVALAGVPYILMHSRGTPADMSRLTQYEDMLVEILDYFIEISGNLRALGIKDVIIDPGFGFAKTISQNFDLAKKIHLFHLLNVPLLAGVSRKSMIYKTLGTTPENALNGTSALHMYLLLQGVNILRVHDVKEAAEVIALYRQLVL